MLFSIDKAKIDKLMALESDWHDEAAAPDADLPAETESSFYPSYMAGGTSFGSPTPTSPESTRYLLALRRRIEASGITLISGEELDTEVREMRG